MTKKDRKKRVSWMCLIIFSIMFIGLVNGSGIQKFCLDKGQVIEFSKCNPSMDDYICDATTCQICVNEIRSKVYCPSNGCNELCIDYEEPDPEEELPEITLISPGSFYINEEIEEIDFEFEVSRSYQISSEGECSLAIDDEIVESYEGRVQSSSIIISYTPQNGTHSWRIECTTRESYGSKTVISEERTLVIGTSGDGDDGNGSVDDFLIQLVSPVDGNSYTGAQNVEFRYDVKDGVNASELSGCELILNNGGITSVMNSSEVINGVNLITTGVVIGSYVWRVDCTDIDSNITSSNEFSLVVNEVPQDGGNSPGGGNRGGGGPSGGVINRNNSTNSTNSSVIQLTPPASESSEESSEEESEENPEEEVVNQEIEPESGFGAITGAAILNGVKNPVVLVVILLVIAAIVLGILGFKRNGKKDEASEKKKVSKKKKK